MAFDLRTSVRNKKGQIIQDSPYTLYIEDGVRVYERPPGSGEFFYENGEVASEKHRPAAAPKPEAKKADRRAIAAKTADLNKKIKEHNESEGEDRLTAPELSDADEDALADLLNEKK